MSCVRARRFWSSSGWKSQRRCLQPILFEQTMSNLEHTVTALLNQVAFLEANKNDTWEGVKELWQLTREVEELIQGTGSLILRVHSQVWHRQSRLTQRSQPSWRVSLQVLSGWREWTRSPCSPSVRVS